MLSICCMTCTKASEMWNSFYWKKMETFQECGCTIFMTGYKVRTVFISSYFKLWIGEDERNVTHKIGLFEKARIRNIYLLAKGTFIHEVPFSHRYVFGLYLKIYNERACFILCAGCFFLYCIDRILRAHMTYSYASQWVFCSWTYISRK